MKTRSLLLCGALAFIVPLSGCSSLGQLSQAVGVGFQSYKGAGSGLVNAVGGAYVSVGKVVAGDSADVKTTESSTPEALNATATTSASAVAETAPVAVAPAPVASVAKKAPAKKVVIKPSSVKTVADTTKKPK